MPDPRPKCLAPSDEPGPLQWRCSRSINHDDAHAALDYLGKPLHIWEDQA